MVSAATGEGLEKLQAAMEAELSRVEMVMDVSIPVEDGRGLAWFYANTTVLARTEDEGSIMLRVSVDPSRRDKAMRYMR